ncbi:MULTISPECIES: mannonate dehydratase [Chelativorans]|uniref:Mannonate dehydratase n=1 Tax=Chelativorans sp. (strain BNC1) TaxID=266779 RepID=Q11AP9_CHESB|nr:MULTISPECIES: mannonate dehydratase [Chelativorans]
MKQTWRWFGPRDTATIDDVVQAGAEGIVTALHHLPNGAVWTRKEIVQRQAEISLLRDGSPSGLRWDVVESLPVSEEIKTQTGAWRSHVENYCASLENLWEAGIETICYNFMPILDWTRTDLRWRLPHGGRCMRFDLVDFAVFDVFLLKRAGASASYPEAIVEEAARREAGMDDASRERLVQNATCGLPGANQTLTINDVRELLGRYQQIGPDLLRRHLYDFLELVIPTAERLGLRLCCHPDDPPFSLLGLPRIMSTEEDYADLMRQIDSPANGMTLCSGSLGARPDNDLTGMMRRLGDRVHFLHLRNVHRESGGIPASFHESAHLDGDVDMVSLMAEVLREEARRSALGRADHSIPMRPDHGHDICDDLNRSAQPGYATIGRLRGLAELRGVHRALTHPGTGLT